MAQQNRVSPSLLVFDSTGFAMCREVTSAPLSKNWPTAWTRPRTNAPSSSSRSTPWNLNSAKCKRKSQRCQNRTRLFQVSHRWQVEVSAIKLHESKSEFSNLPRFDYRWSTIGLSGLAWTRHSHRGNGDFFPENQWVDQDINLRGTKARETPPGQNW